MSPLEMINKIIDQYKELQNIHPDFRDRTALKRKSNHVISSYLEDIVAAYTLDFLQHEEFELWIDQTYTFKNKKTFKPDITIVRNHRTLQEIKGFIEVKDSANPFRWKKPDGNNNTSLEYIDNRINILKEIYEFPIQYKNDKHKIDIAINRKAKIDLVLISDQLFSRENHKKLRKYCDTDDVSNFLNLHILLKGYNPNPKSNNEKFTACLLKNIIKETDLAFDTYNNRLVEISKL